MSRFVSLIALVLSAPALARTPEPVATAEPAPIVTAAKIDRRVMARQIALARAGFSSGVVDGRVDLKYIQAVRGFQVANGLPSTGGYGPATRAKVGVPAYPTTIRLAVSAADAAGPFTGKQPKDIVDKAELPVLAHENLAEAIAEKFHTTTAVLAGLNDGRLPEKAGDIVIVPNVRGLPAAAAADPASPTPPPAEAPPAKFVSDNPASWAAMLNDLSVDAEQPKAARVVVDKSDKIVLAYDAAGKLIAQFPATIGSEENPLPIGEWKINVVAKLPDYSYDPKVLKNGKDDPKVKLAPGPNSPVGVAWLDLSKDHYGIHGTPQPARIGEGYSAGCVRLTNWDVARLAQMVDAGTPAILRP